MLLIRKMVVLTAVLWVDWSPGGQGTNTKVQTGENLVLKVELRPGITYGSGERGCSGIYCQDLVTNC